jgi:hypothetical protein
VGNFDGENVGFRVGDFVGKDVGNFDGENVGFRVGDFVGVEVGLLLGLLVGSFVGGLVGGLVGDLVGSLVGSLVGDLVGSLVGSLVGDLVGLLVGVAVGRDGESVCCVGEFVSVIVGAAVGDSLVGAADGAAVVGIELVGEAVGDAVSVIIKSQLSRVVLNGTPSSFEASRIAARSTIHRARVSSYTMYVEPHNRVVSTSHRSGIPASPGTSLVPGPHSQSEPHKHRQSSLVPSHPKVDACSL